MNKELIIIEFLVDRGDYKKGDRTCVTLLHQYLIDEGIVKIIEKDNNVTKKK